MKLYLVPNWFDVDRLCDDDVAYHDKRKLVVDYESYENLLNNNVDLNKAKLEALEQCISLLVKRCPTEQTYCDTYRNALSKVIEMADNLRADIESKLSA